MVLQATKFGKVRLSITGRVQSSSINLQCLTNFVTTVFMRRCVLTVYFLVVDPMKITYKFASLCIKINKLSRKIVDSSKLKIG